MWPDTVAITGVSEDSVSVIARIFRILRSKGNVCCHKTGTVLLDQITVGQSYGVQALIKKQ